MERQIMICECHSLEHQVIFWYDEEDGDLYCEPHLTTHRNFFKRLWYGLKYAFGYKSRFGDWDSTIFKKEDLEKLRAYLYAQTNEYPLNDLPSDEEFINQMEGAEVDGGAVH